VKDSDNIEDWYKGALDNYSVEPDNAVWQSLSDDLDASTPLTDETISEWYKKEVYRLNEIRQLTEFRQIKREVIHNT